MKQKYLKWVLTASVIIGLIVAGVKYLNAGEVLEAIKRFDYIYALFMMALSVGYLALKSWRFVLLMRPLTDLSWGVISKAFLAGQAATLLPGGVAARAGLMNQIGMPVAESGVPVIFSSGLDQVVFIAGSLLAALWFEGAQTPALIILAVVALAVAILLIPITRHWLIRAAGWIAGKLHGREQWHSFLKTVPKVATRQILLSTLAITVVAFGLRVVALDLSLLGVGLNLTYPELFLAYILPTMLGRIFPIPGGVGVTEAGMVGFLASTAQTDVETTTAAVAIFRVITIVFEALLGALVYFFSWRGESELSSTS